MAAFADPLPGKIANAIEALAGEMLTELSVGMDDRGTIEDYIDMLSTNPWACAGSTTKTLNLLQRMGTWTHENEEIHNFIEENWAQMRGSFKLSISEMATAHSIGWSASEFALREPEGDRWLIESLQLIPPKYHRFEGRRGQIEAARYYPSQGIDVPIPYERIVHIVNKREIAALTDRPPYGIADCRLAIAAHKAWKIILNEALIAGQRQATPILVGYQDAMARVAMLDKNGQPMRSATGEPVTIPASQKLLQDMQSLNKNGGVIAMGVTDATKGKIEALQQQTDGRFFLEMLQLLQRTIMLSFMVPFTTVEEGVRGLGNAGLASEQLKNMRLMLNALAEQIQEELTEKVIRPLIEWNFGEQESYGEWIAPAEEDEDSIALLGALNQSFQIGLYSTADLEAVNRHRHLAGIPEVSEVVQSLSKPRHYWKEAA